MLVAANLSFIILSSWYFVNSIFLAFPQFCPKNSQSAHGYDDNSDKKLLKNKRQNHGTS